MRGAFIAMLLGLLAGCSRDPVQVATGPGSETSGVSARVVDASGAPVAGASVRMVSVDAAWQAAVVRGEGAVLDRRTTDAQGWVRFAAAREGWVALELEDSAHGARGEVDLSQTRSAELRVQAGGRVRLSAKVPGETVRAVGLAGTAYAARQIDGGAWVLSGVPQGEYAVVALTDSGMALLGRVAVASGAVLDTALSADADSVLLEDFAFDPVRNRYGWLLGAGWWYTTTDAIYGDHSTVTPDDPVRMRIPCPYGNCVSATFSVDTLSSQRFALVGVDVDHPFDSGGPLANQADFSRVSAVRFPVSGQGGIQFQIHYRLPDATSSACHQSVTLSGGWKVVDVTLSTMSCDTKLPAGSRAVGMTWVAVDDARLNLGPVTLLGAGPRQVFAKLRRGGVP